ncbi:MAG TPA: type II secretion system F family protein [Rhizomicrobium sp.]|jgi:tight adherence protein B|nr:type II secretion system F family protein [Rhizomicrobium sp.]
MSPDVLYGMSAVLVVLALGGAYLAFSGGGSAQRRVDAIAKAPAAGLNVRGGNNDANQAAKRKNVNQLLKEIEKQQKENKKKPSLRKRINQAGFDFTPQTYWIGCAVLGVVVALACFITKQAPLVIVLATFGMAIGLPRWVLNFLIARRMKQFTTEFANAIDVIVRSVKSGLPTNEALKIVAKEIPDPVGSEFFLLNESMRVGVTLDQALKKMYDNMPTPEVAFFSIVMTIQQKSGGNLSEALSNLAGVLRERKRLQGKIKAMSSEAKASAAIIGSLPPGVMGVVYVTTPDYIMLLFTEHLGNLMLLACAVWMSMGIMVMRKMINFKH